MKIDFDTTAYYGNSLVKSIYRGNSLITYQPTDPDAASYISSVEAADGQFLEAYVRKAIDEFVIGCKSDGIWDAIQAACIMAGARTITGMRQPLKGPAPTVYNFVSEDYSRTLGLKGNGATKYIDSNLNSDDVAPLDTHISVYVSEEHSPMNQLIGSGFHGSSTLMLFLPSPKTIAFRNRTTQSGANQVVTNISGLVGTSRSDGTVFYGRNNGVGYTKSQTSTGVGTVSNIVVFKRANDNSQFSASRQAFYSIGGALDLAALDARVSTLMTDIGSALA